jgi:hypothetical protein
MQKPDDNSNEANRVLDQIKKEIDFTSLFQIRGYYFKYFKEISRQKYRENFFFNRIAT